MSAMSIVWKKFNEWINESESKYQPHFNLKNSSCAVSSGVIRQESVYAYKSSLVLYRVRSCVVVRGSWSNSFPSNVIVFVVDVCIAVCRCWMPLHFHDDDELVWWRMMIIFCLFFTKKISEHSSSAMTWLLIKAILCCLWATVTLIN